MVGTATHSQIIVYSVQGNTPRFNSFDMAEKKWSGPALYTQAPPNTASPFPTTPDEGNGNHGGNNGIDSGKSTSGTSNGAIIGGAIAGVLFLVILVVLFIIQRKRRCNREGHSRKRSLTRGGNSSGQRPESAEENIPALSDYQQDLSAPPPHLFEASGSFNTLSSSAVPLTGIPPRPLSAPPQPLLVNQNRAVAPPSIPPRPQHQQQLLLLQQPRRGFSVEDIEVISFPSIHEKHKYEQEQEQQRLQREEERQR